MKARIAMTMAIGVLIAVSGIVYAQSGGDPSVAPGANYELTWYTVDSGGASFSTGDGYQLGGAIGQPDAGELSGGDYTLVGGFWQGGAASNPPGYYIYLPLVLK